MLKSTLIVLTTLATLATAQSPLATLTGGTNSGNSGGGIYFDLQVNTTITITQIAALTGSPTTNLPASNTPVAGPSILEVWLGPSTYLNNVTNANLWTLVATGTGNVAMTTMVPFTLTTPLCLAPGNYGVALRSVLTATTGVAMWGHGYTNGGNCSSSTVPGSCTNPASIFSNNELTIRAGAAQNGFLTGSPFTPRVFNGQIHYTLGGTPIAVAAWENYGVGCNRYRTSWHEIFPNPASTDVSNTTLTIGVGPTSPVTLGGTPYTAPSATATPITFSSSDASVLATTMLGGPLPVPVLFNQGGSLQVATDLEINADGYITPVPSSVVWGGPAVASFLSGGPRWCPHWKNMDVLGGGNVTIEVEPTGTLVVSWNAVKDAGTGNTGTSTFQVAFTMTGDVEYRYGAISVGGGGSYPVIIGWSHGGGALANEVDASVAGFVTHPTDNAELSLAMNARPRIGTTPAFVATNLPAGSPFGVVMLDLVQINPGASLAGFGAPNCFQYTGAGIVQLVLPTGGQLSQPFPIPNSTAFNGVIVLGQMAAFAAGQNPLGIVFTNGTRMFMGSL